MRLHLIVLLAGHLIASGAMGLTYNCSSVIRDSLTEETKNHDLQVVTPGIIGEPLVLEESTKYTLELVTDKTEKVLYASLSQKTPFVRMSLAATSINTEFINQIYTAADGSLYTWIYCQKVH